MVSISNHLLKDLDVAEVLRKKYYREIFEGGGDELRQRNWFTTASLNLFLERLLDLVLAEDGSDLFRAADRPPNRPPPTPTTSSRQITRHRWRRLFEADNYRMLYGFYQGVLATRDRGLECFSVKAFRDVFTLIANAALPEVVTIEQIVAGESSDGGAASGDHSVASLDTSDPRLQKAQQQQRRIDARAHGGSPTHRVKHTSAETLRAAQRAQASSRNTLEMNYPALPLQVYNVDENSRARINDKAEQTIMRHSRFLRPSIQELHVSVVETGLDFVTQPASWSLAQPLTHIAKRRGWSAAAGSGNASGHAGRKSEEHITTSTSPPATVSLFTHSRQDKGFLMLYEQTIDVEECGMELYEILHEYPEDSTSGSAASSSGARRSSSAASCTAEQQILAEEDARRLHHVLGFIRYGTKDLLPSPDVSKISFGDRRDDFEKEKKRVLESVTIGSLHHSRSLEDLFIPQNREWLAHHPFLGEEAVRGEAAAKETTAPTVEISLPRELLHHAPRLNHAQTSNLNTGAAEVEEQRNYDDLHHDIRPGMSPTGLKTLIAELVASSGTSSAGEVGGAGGGNAYAYAFPRERSPQEEQELLLHVKRAVEDADPPGTSPAIANANLAQVLEMTLKAEALAQDHALFRIQHEMLRWSFLFALEAASTEVLAAGSAEVLAPEDSRPAEDADKIAASLRRQQDSAPLRLFSDLFRMGTAYYYNGVEESFRHQHEGRLEDQAENRPHQMLRHVAAEDPWSWHVRTNIFVRQRQDGRPLLRTPGVDSAVRDVPMPSDGRWRNIFNALLTAQAALHVALNYQKHGRPNLFLFDYYGLVSIVARGQQAAQTEHRHRVSEAMRKKVGGKEETPPPRPSGSQLIWSALSRYYALLGVQALDKLLTREFDWLLHPERVEPFLSDMVAAWRATSGYALEKLPACRKDAEIQRGVDFWWDFQEVARALAHDVTASRGLRHEPRKPTHKTVRVEQDRRSAITKPAKFSWKQWTYSATVTDPIMVAFFLQAGSRLVQYGNLFYDVMHENLNAFLERQRRTARPTPPDAEADLSVQYKKFAFFNIVQSVIPHLAGDIKHIYTNLLRDASCGKGVHDVVVDDPDVVRAGVERRASVEVRNRCSVRHILEGLSTAVTLLDVFPRSAKELWGVISVVMEGVFFLEQDFLPKQRLLLAKHWEGLTSTGDAYSQFRDLEMYFWGRFRAAVVRLALAAKVGDRVMVPGMWQKDVAGSSRDNLKDLDNDDHIMMNKTTEIMMLKTLTSSQHNLRDLKTLALSPERKVAEIDAQDRWKIRENEGTIVGIHHRQRLEDRTHEDVIFQVRLDAEPSKLVSVRAGIARFVAQTRGHEDKIKGDEDVSEDGVNLTLLRHRVVSEEHPNSWLLLGRESGSAKNEDWFGSGAEKRSALADLFPVQLMRRSKREGAPIMKKWTPEAPKV
eukprot:g16382.t1